MSADGAMGRRGGGIMRLKGLIRKEFLQIVRDPSSIAIAFFLPVLLLFLFGFGVSLDAEHVPVALVVEAESPEATSFTAAFGHSKYFRPVHMRDFREAEKALVARTVDAVVRLRARFAQDLNGGLDTPIQVVVNGVDANSARLVAGYVDGVWQGWLAERARSGGGRLALPVSVEQRIWYNAEVRSRNFLVPGLIAVIMTLIGALLTAMVMAREWERGTLEALMVTPVTLREVILGKLIPYFVMGMGGMTLSVLLALWVFDVPLRGSLTVLFGAAALFLLVALCMGLLISIVAKNQFVAGQAAILVTFLPAFLLSGFIFDIGAMPQVVRGITHIIAARYFVAILQSVFLAGDLRSVILPNAGALALLAIIFLVLIRRKARKRLD